MNLAEFRGNVNGNGLRMKLLQIIPCTQRYMLIEALIFIFMLVI